MEIREKEQVKQRVQRRIVLCSVMLMAGKFAAYFLTNSVGVLTDAMESIVNVTAGLISLYSLYRAARPADRNHPFGYGKIELISASIEGLLILLAGAAIVYEGIRRLFVPSQIEQLDTGIAIVAAAGAVNYLLGLYSIRTGRRYDSVALVAGGRHLQSDTYSTIGLVAGLVLLYVTRIGWIDSALAMLFGGIIAWTGISILRKTASDLMDTADERYLEKMLETVSRHPRPDWIDIHNLKIIRYGSYAYIDCDLTLPWYYTVRQGHKACEERQAGDRAKLLGPGALFGTLGPVRGTPLQPLLGRGVPVPPRSVRRPAGLHAARTDRERRAKERVALPGRTTPAFPAETGLPALPEIRAG